MLSSITNLDPLKSRDDSLCRVNRFLAWIW